MYLDLYELLLSFFSFCLSPDGLKSEKIYPRGGQSEGKLLRPKYTSFPRKQTEDRQTSWTALCLATEGRNGKEPSSSTYSTCMHFTYPSLTKKKKKKKLQRVARLAAKIAASLLNLTFTYLRHFRVNSLLLSTQSTFCCCFCSGKYWEGK